VVRLASCSYRRRHVEQRGGYQEDENRPIGRRAGDGEACQKERITTSPPPRGIIRPAPGGRQGHPTRPPQGGQVAVATTAPGAHFDSPNRVAQGTVPAMDLFRLQLPAWEIVVRSVVVYGVLLAGLRLFGKREVGQFTLFDLVLVLLVANAVQPAMTGPDTSLAGGVIIIVTLVVVNFALSRLDRYGAFRRLLQSEATPLVRNGRRLRQSMEREGVDDDELDTAIRGHGLEDVKQVRLAMLEPDGSISVIGTDQAPSRSRRRRIFRRRSG
jgi:uncharacterized membrane protein YcaP (DUF421 family)